MNLTSEQVSNLCLLADFMEGLVLREGDKFDMRMWHFGCGSPACALGWATTVPALREKGLTFDIFNQGIMAPVRACERHFGVFIELFDGHLNIRTPQQWAAYCRAFLKENGYDITKPDPFKIFMEKTLERVETQEPEFHHWRTA